MAITKLTSLSFTDDSVVAAAIADNAIGSSELNLAANYAFTGTVTGAGGGVSGIDTWHITSNFTSPSGGYATSDITANWVRNAQAYSGTVLTSQLGTAMTESSGVFTFPATGHWLLRWHVLFVNGGTTTNECASWIYVSNDSGSNYTKMTDAAGSVKHEAGNEYIVAPSQSYIDVTNASTFRVKFAVRTSHTLLAVSGGAAASELRTYAQFVKQADT